MSKAILLFDEHININELKNINKSEEVDIFPLTSNWSVINAVRNICTSEMCVDDSAINLLDSARLINDEVDKIRTRVSEWSSNLGDCKVWDKSIKEWFLTPKGEITTWWFSLLSEKNTLKTDVFFRIAQVQAFEELLKYKDYDVCRLSIKERRFKKVVKNICKIHSVQVKISNSIVTAPHISKELIRKSLDRIGFCGDVVYSLVWIVDYVIKGFKAKKIMGSLANRSIKKNSILVVSYFPAVDKKASEKGSLRNKYFIPLQDKLAKKNKPITWLFMYVPIDGYSYSDALRLGRKLANNGEVLFFLEELLSVRTILYSIFVWLNQIYKYLILTVMLNPRFLINGLTDSESMILLYALWRRSFVGETGIRGIVYFELYKRAFNSLKTVSHCIYLAEMHAWENALNAANELRSQKVKTIGFQHTSVPRNFFHYFHHDEEMKDDRKEIKFPLPDVLACNGDISYHLMAKQGYPNLKKVEAIRQLYLNKYLSNSNVKIGNKVPILLVACSFDRNETILLISLLNEAFPGKRNFKIWLKGHPAQPVDEILRVLDIDDQKCGYEIKDSPVDILLNDATIVMAGSTIVALEALAVGCKVVLPVFSDYMFMSPLNGHDKYYTKIYDPDGLRHSVQTLLEKDVEEALITSSKQFISSYWYLDETLKDWEKLLS
ncbi:MAG: hypothetical protein K8F52_13410 [Candidatus Scalindua rubra]|uniref:Uncharacterized protein n=1 Tax=Candidatus Scalindua brodae TaxID=237368 RepID=A0A0B0EQC9_9BACT|nr:MAG: hypothetical protein SCABRO_00143 [Candidatus Scalindua brodae]MBZ0109657.1 hypothetical protein [Candidatus Scalindua rubra]TWU33088.1 hypothetical protein S225a_15380 [Candidatus Brocadiaceae bacterium S225]